MINVAKLMPNDYVKCIELNSYLTKKGFIKGQKYQVVLITTSLGDGLAIDLGNDNYLSLTLSGHRLLPSEWSLYFRRVISHKL